MGRFERHHPLIGFRTYDDALQEVGVMGFFKKLLKQSVKSALKDTPQKSARQEPTYEEKDFAFSVDFDDWLNGKDLFDTNLYRKHPEVKQRAHKALIEKTIEAYGAFDMNYGRDFENSGTFIPLKVDEEKVVCRESTDTYDGDAETPPQKTFKLEKIELNKFIPVVSEEIQLENIKIIEEAIQKKGFFTMFGYTDEKGIYRDDLFDESIPVKFDEEFLYVKKPGGKKEYKIRLKWIEELDFDIEEEEE